MKNTVLAIISAILGVLTLMIVMTIYGRVNRSMELKSSLSSVVEETVENMALNSKYCISNTNEFLADLVENLAIILDAQSDIEVDILQCDKERGILAVKVAVSYLYPNGNKGMVECERTVILNKQQEYVPEQYQVEFYVEEELYKKYSVKEESAICAPANPKEGGKLFYGWLDVNGNLADFSIPVKQDAVYYADMR